MYKPSIITVSIALSCFSLIRLQLTGCSLQLEMKTMQGINKTNMFWHLGKVPSAMKSPLSPGWWTPRGPLYRSRPSADSVMNSREMWLLKQGFMGGNQA